MRVDPADRPAHRGSPPPRLRARVSTAQDSRAVCGDELARSAAVGAAVARPPTIEDQDQDGDPRSRSRCTSRPTGIREQLKSALRRTTQLSSRHSKASHLSRPDAGPSTSSLARGSKGTLASAQSMARKRTLEYGRHTATLGIRNSSAEAATAARGSISSQAPLYAMSGTHRVLDARQSSPIRRRSQLLL